MKPTEIKTPGTVCPSCGYAMDVHTVAEGVARPPKAGDLSVCLKCGEINVFDKDLKLREPTVTDAMYWSTEEFQLARQAQDLIRRKRFIA